MPEFRSRQALVERLYEHFYDAGFDYRAAKAVKAEPCRWLRPPLYTRLKLAGEPMQPYLAVPVAGTPDALCDVYERFIGGFLYSKQLHDTDSDTWLAGALGLGRYEARCLFARPQFNHERLGLHQHLVQFAALVGYNHPASVEKGNETFVVVSERDGLQFGVRDGRLVSNLRRERRQIPVRFLASGTGSLADLTRGGYESNARSTLLDTLWRWTAANRARLGDTADALQLGLTILWWRMPAGAAPGGLRLLLCAEQSRPALQSACGKARQYESFEDPITTLKGLFVPGFVKPKEFAEMFGDPHQRVTTPVPASIRQKWDQAINSLDPGHGGFQ